MTAPASATDAATQVPELPVGPEDAGEAEETSAPDVHVAEDPGDPSLFGYLVVDPEAVVFGAQEVGAVVTRPVELENAGTLGLTVTAIELLGQTGSFGTNLSSLVLGPGQKRTLLVTFYALEEGSAQDTLRLHSNAANAAHRDIPLSGEGAVAACEDADGDDHGPGCAAGPDCNDSDPEVYVGAPERCNGLDDDCDGLHDEDFVGLGAGCEAGFGACVTPGFKICAADQQSLVCSVNPVTGGSELCNEVDDDCDGATDEDFPSKGKLCHVGTGACAAFDKYVCTADGTALVCNVTPGQPIDEVCDDGVDNDCDGVTDEGQLEVCGDGVDNDCDGETDESGSPWGELFFVRNHFGQAQVTPANGDGTFGEPVLVDFPEGANHQAISVGDFDNDQFLDLVVIRTDTQGKQACLSTADCPGAHVCWAGVCRPNCTSDAQCDVGAGNVCIDTHQNNSPDNVVCVPSRDILLARSSCDGEGAIELTPMFTLAPGETLGPVIDADNNGQLDFVGLRPWAEKTGFTVLNDGQGGFTRVEASVNLQPMFTYQYDLALTSKDLDGDGFVDLVGTSFSNGGSPPTVIYLVRGNGDGTFQDPVKVGTNVPYPANMVTANDFDGDGDHDILAGLDDDGQPGAVWMMLNRGAPSGKSWVAPYEAFDLVPNFNSGGEHPGVGRGTSYDFSGDGLPDVLAVWTPQECGSYVWGCPAVTDVLHPCHGGLCRKIAYVPNQTGKACLPGTLCVDGQCQSGCTPDCTGKQCGDDGCSGSCGVCAGGQQCAAGKCVVDCVPHCAGKVCGPNGCGGQCGECAPGEACVTGQCQAGCVPSCAGKACGDDGCGGRCVTFGVPEVLYFDNNPTMGLYAPTNVPPTAPKVAIAAATSADDLVCAVVTPSYDLDPVTYRRRWYRDGGFVAAVDDQEVVPAAMTQPGETWECRVRARDAVEWSPVASATVKVAP